MRTHRDRRDEQGFTLIELLVVITIISILAAVVSVSVGGFITTANEKTRQAQFAAVQTAVDTYVSTHLDASGDLSQATYPIASGDNTAAGAARPWLNVTINATGEWSNTLWYGPDGKVCGDPGAKCLAQPSGQFGSTRYIYVDLYSTATNPTTSLVLGSFIAASSAGKTMGIPGTVNNQSSGGTSGFRCIYFAVAGASYAKSDLGTADFAGLAAPDVATGKSNVRTNKGAVMMCRDTDPASP